MDELAATYEQLRRSFKRRRMNLPVNRGLRRDLDCLVINELIAASPQVRGMAFQTVRCPFLEGAPVFPGSGIQRESHVQISVIDPSCILGIFRPNLP